MCVRAHALDVVVFLEGSIATRVFAVLQSEHPSRGFCIDAFCADLFCPSVNGACQPCLVRSCLKSFSGLSARTWGFGKSVRDDRMGVAFVSESCRTVRVRGATHWV